MGIKVFNNFMKKEDCQNIINYINDNLNKFSQSQENKYYALMFGKDNYFSNSKTEISDMDAIIKTVKIYFDKIKRVYELIQLLTLMFVLYKFSAGSTPCVVNPICANASN